MAENRAILGGTQISANDLANRWFQPLTHVSEARTPRESSFSCQRAKREKREMCGYSWHSGRHSLFGACSAETKRAATVLPTPRGPDHMRRNRIMGRDLFTAEARETHLSDWPVGSGEANHILAGRRVFFTGRQVPDGVGGLTPQVFVETPGEKINHTSRPRPAKATIYFIAPQGGPIKIGYASRIEFRLNDLRLMNPYPLELLASVEGPHSLEREYHKRFAEHRLHGEWFSPHPDILAEIERLNREPSS